MSVSNWSAAAVALALPVSASAAPPAFPPYPTARTEAAIREWVAAQTDIQPGQILIIQGGAVYATQSSADDRDEGGISARTIREEVIDPALAARLGGRSSRALVDFDCIRKTYGVVRGGVFPGNNLSGGGETPMSGAAWMKASPVYLFELAHGVCGASRSPVAEAPAPGPAAATPPAPSAEPASPIAPPAERAAPEPAAPEPAAAPVAAPRAEPRAEPAAEPRLRAARTIWLQAGAFASPKLAEAKWSGLETHLAPGVSHKLEPAPGGALTRLLVGPFPSQATAAAACARLRSAGADCFVRR